jgi:CCR4-NOT transcription complex subunit 1
MSVPAPATGADATPEREKEITDTISFNAQVLATFANVLHLTQPARVPGFAFAWLELVSHRLFLPALLAVPARRGWPLLHRLMVHILRFLYPFTRRGEMNEGLRLLHKGMLRMLLILYHDTPDFLSDYAWTLLELVPVHATQARNIITAAAPRAVRTPELPAKAGTSLPLSTVSQAMESLVESSIVPRVLGSPSDAVPAGMRDQLELYMRTASQAPTPARTAAAAALAPVIRAAMLAEQEEAVLVLGRYSTRVIGAFVQHTLALACTRLAGETPGAELNPTRIPIHALSATGSSGPILELMKAVLSSTGPDGGLDPEGRYLLVHALVSQLRFPSAHTLIMTRILLSVYGEEKEGREGTTVVLRETLVRVLVERLIAHRPHPWSVLVLFVELLRAPSYHLASQIFLHGSPEVERLFETVARSCLGGQVPQGWVPVHANPAQVAT